MSSTSSPQEPLEALSTPTQQPQRTDDARLRPFQVGEELPARMGVADMCRAFAVNGRPMTASGFYRLCRKGKFDRFELLPRIGARAWSGKLVAQYLRCEGVARFSLAKRSA